MARGVKPVSSQDVLNSVWDDTTQALKTQGTANSGVDIGDVDVASIAAGTSVIGKVRLVGSGGQELSRGTAQAVRILPVVSYYVVNPFANGNLTTNGIQYSTPVVTTSGTFAEVQASTINPGHSGTLKQIEVGLTGEIAASGTAQGVNLKWQGRNTGGTYVDLCGTVAYAAAASAAKEYTVSGYFTPTANFNQVQCDVRMMVQSTGTASGTGRTKNSSYLAFVYVPDAD